MGLLKGGRSNGYASRVARFLCDLKLSGVAIQRNTFGEVVAEYTSGLAGAVMGRRSDATAEPGIPLIAILYNDATHEFPVDYSE